MRHWSREVIERFLMHKSVVLAAAVLFAAAFFAAVFVNSTGDISVSGHKISCSYALETVVLANGDSVINDNAQAITCTDRKGNLKYRKVVKKSQLISGITTDDDNNIYAYLSNTKQGGDLMVSDEICRYSMNGKKRTVLYTIDYTDNGKEIYGHTSPLRYENGYIYFTGYKKNVAEIFKINAVNGKTVKVGELHYSSPYLYQDIDYHADGVYYYVKSTGEIGKGRINGREQVLYYEKFSISDESGFRPFYIRTSGDAVYVLDYWGGNVFQIKDGSLKIPEVRGETGLFSDSASELSACGKGICGISNGQPWYIDGGKLKKLPSYARVSFVRAAGTKLVMLSAKIAIPFMILDFVFLLFLALFLTFVRGKKIFWKLMMTNIIIAVVFAGSMYFVVSNEYDTFRSQSKETQQELVRVASGNIDPADLEKAADSSFFNSKNYRRITNTIIRDFHMYQVSSDTAAVVMVPDKNNDKSYYIASNRGFGELLGSNSTFDDLTGEITYKNRYVTKESDNKIISCAGIFDSSGKTAGYLCVFIQSKNVNDSFFNMWSVPMMLGWLMFTLIIIFFSSRGTSRVISRISQSIQEISEGNFDTRLNDLPNDEIGDIGKSVNAMAGNIESLIRENDRRGLAIRKSQEEVLVSLASITEEKSGQTGAHVKRVAEYVRILASDLGYAGNELSYLCTAAMLHDIGKLMVPNEILEKPAGLSPEEYEIMKRHTQDGEKLIANAPGRIMEYARIIALEHHERWDGTGYNEGLAGEEIHIEARMTALADVFDALVSSRSYKDAYSFKTAYDIIVSERGRQFDPDIVDLFIEHFDEFCAVAAGDGPDEIIS